MSTKFKDFKKYAIKYALISYVGILAITLISGSLSGQITAVQGDVDTEEIRSIIIEGWESDNWQIEAIPGPPDGIATMKLVNGFPSSLATNTRNKRSLGIRYSFVYPGHNSIILTPPKTRNIRRAAGKLDESNRPIYLETPGIELPGKIKGLSVWVLGRGNNGFLEAWVQDWKGDTHILKLGSINFVGWRPLSAEMPSWVPQSAISFPRTRSMVFKRFVIRSDPNAPTEEIVIFLDSFKVLTNIYDLHFDGAEISYDEIDKKNKETLTKYSKQLLDKFSD